MRRLLKRVGVGVLDYVKANHFQAMVNVYPPYLGAGIRLDSISDDGLTCEVSMRLGALNRNYVGTHFGGSLYSMCDPWFMLILLKQLGPDFVVWDKAASIQFRRPGRGRVKARFHVSAAEVARVREQVLREGRAEPTYVASIRGEDDKVVAKVEKTLHVRSKESE